MSHFYGTLQGNRGQVTRGGTANSGLTTVAAGWRGAIKVHVTETPDGDVYDVYLIQWHGSQGQPRCIASGKLDSSVNGSDS